MLILRLCGIPFDTIINEYMVSARTMRIWCEEGRPGLVDHLKTREILSVEREYMIQAVEYLKMKYGDVGNYLESCGVDRESQEAVKRHLVRGARDSGSVERLGQVDT
jgi:hypothetical protein